jgi:hypothetical protein
MVCLDQKKVSGRQLLRRTPMLTWEQQVWGYREMVYHGVIANLLGLEYL